MSFADKLIKSRNHLIRLVTGKNNGQAAWWVLKVDAPKFEIYKAKMAAGNIGNLDDFGTVLQKGWGETAPTGILKKIEEEYS